MARARNIKPGLFKNEDLAECSVWARYIFPGLWTMADRKGRLEDRPKRIKGELLPYDSIEVEPLLAELERWNFIQRYTVDGVPLIQILKFAKHQNPHKREQPSKLPAPPGFVEPKPDAGNDEGPAEPEASGRLSEAEAAGLSGALGASDEPEAPDKPGASTGPAPGLGVMEGGVSPADSLFSDSLIPDSLNSDSGKGSRGGKPPKPDLPPGFVRFWAAWPKHFRKGEKGECLQVWRKHGCEEIVDSIVLHVERKKGSRDWTKESGEFVPAPLVYLRKRRWEGADGLDGADPAAAGPKWFEQAGFPTKDDALNAGCHGANYRQFHDGRRSSEVTA